MVRVLYLPNNNHAFIKKIIKSCHAWEILTMLMKNWSKLSDDDDDLGGELIEAKNSRELN